MFNRSMLRLPGPGLQDVISFTPAAAARPAAAHSQLLELIPLFDDTKQFLRKVQTKDSSTPRLEASELKQQGCGTAHSQLLELIPLFDETKQFLNKVEKRSGAIMLSICLHPLHFPIWFDCQSGRGEKEQNDSVSAMAGENR